MKTFILDGIEIGHLNHAGFKIKDSNNVIYIDPFQSGDQEKADLIFISHDHFDHFDPQSLAALKKNETIVVGPKTLENKILSSFKPMSPNDQLDIKGVKISTIPAYNLTKEHHPKEKGYLGYILEIDGKRLYHAGDTDATPEMNALQEIDVAMIPIGGGYTMDEAEAAEAVNAFKPKIVIPMHYSDEVIPEGDAEKFKSLVKNSKVEILE